MGNNSNDLIKACTDCLCACKCATNKAWSKEGSLSEQERKCACMWNDAATACEACIHCVGRGSPNAGQMVKLCHSICETCAKACEACTKEGMKENRDDCNKVADACKKVCNACKECGFCECKKCA